MPVVIVYFLARLSLRNLALQWKESVRQLKMALDVASVGLFVDGLTMPLEQTTASIALIALLPRLKASDAALLNARRRDILNYQLARNARFWSCQNYPLHRAILKAYEQVGGADALPFVERLAQGKGAARRRKALQAAAQKCLPCLRLRLQKRDAQQTLLRAASGVAASPEQLLRPAASNQETAPQRLLRVSGPLCPPP